MLRDYFWSGAALFVSPWLNTVAGYSNVFLLSVFFDWFFMTLFLKKMRIILNPSKPHYHSRLRKPILKIESISRKNIVGKQLFQAICSRYVFRLLHATKFETFSTKLNLKVKVVKLFTGVLSKSCSDEFFRKNLRQESLF